MAIVGGRPSIASTSGFCNWSRNWRAYVDRLSMYFRCPSAKTVSNASVDLPDPDRPVTTTSWSRGMSTEMFLRLCSRAPRTWMDFKLMGACSLRQPTAPPLPPYRAGDPSPGGRGICPPLYGLCKDPQRRQQLYEG